MELKTDNRQLSKNPTHPSLHVVCNQYSFDDNDGVFLYFVFKRRRTFVYFLNTKIYGKQKRGFFVPIEDMRLRILSSEYWEKSWESWEKKKIYLFTICLFFHPVLSPLSSWSRSCSYSIRYFVICIGLGSCLLLC